LFSGARIAAGGLEGAQIVQADVTGGMRTAGERLHERALPRLPGADQHHRRRIAEGGEEAGGDGALEPVHDHGVVII